MRKLLLVFAIVAVSVSVGSSQEHDTGCSSWSTVSVDVHFYPSFGFTETQERVCGQANGMLHRFRRYIEW